jgi:GNAT superfamily N-acetyltransferase
MQQRNPPKELVPTSAMPCRCLSTLALLPNNPAKCAVRTGSMLGQQQESMGSQNDDAEYIVRDTMEADVDSMTTIVTRSFAPDAFMNDAFPDTSTIRQWWAQIYSNALATPSCRLLVAMDGSNVIGLLTLHLSPARPKDSAQSSDEVGGVCFLVPSTSEHPELLLSAFKTWSELRTQSIPERAQNFGIELVAVDREYQNHGIGKRLVMRACELADKEGAWIFLVTTKAKDYYLNLGLGFELRDGDGDDGHVVVRAPAVGST